MSWTPEANLNAVCICTADNAVLFISGKDHRMLEHDLSSEIPPEANAIEILVTTTPSSGKIELRGKLEDDHPLTMGYGSRTTIGVPDDNRLYVVKLPPTEDYTITVMRWME